MRVWLVILCAVLTPFVVGCDENDDAPSTRASSSTAPPSSTPGSTGDLADASLTLTPVAELDAPTAMAVRDGDEALYVTEQAGLVRAVRGGALDSEPVLDLTERVQDGGEQGLLGIAFSPDGSKLYVHYSDLTQGGDNQIDEYEMTDGVVDPASRRPLLSVETLQPNHNGGQLAFGPDDLLYVGLGDGGGAADRGDGHAPGGNGQSLDTLLGKILRIDPEPSTDLPYTIPADNPFAEGGGRPEIWTYGLRNPWRFSFDRETGDLWIGDVGQNAREEIDYLPAGEGAGANFGWNRLEGSQPFEGTPPPDAVAPIFEYPNPDEGCSVTGGFVYRGTGIPDLQGAYVFADYCEGELRALTQAGGGVTAERRLGVSTSNVAAFGEDGDGELYVLSQGEGLLRVDPG
jgi:glucose/arabinose dehydrogenase